jgi:hypothetical protein
MLQRIEGLLMGLLVLVVNGMIRAGAGLLWMRVLTHSSSTDYPCIRRPLSASAATNATAQNENK